MAEVLAATPEEAILLSALRLGRQAQIENTAGRWLRDHLLALAPAPVARAQLERSLRFEM